MLCVATRVLRPLGVTMGPCPHSLRRLADSCARRYREYTKTTEAQIDLYFGWQERVLKKMMQVHYESLSIRARMALAKITGWM